MPNMKKSKSTDKMPARRMPEGFEFPKNKKAVPNPPGVQRTPASGTKKPAVKKPAVKRPASKPAPLPKPKPKPKVVQMPSKINPSKMTPAQKAKYLQNPERYDK
jgi:hypothetical protein